MGPRGRATAVLHRRHGDRTDTPPRSPPPSTPILPPLPPPSLHFFIPSLNSSPSLHLNTLLGILLHPQQEQPEEKTEPPSDTNAPTALAARVLTLEQQLYEAVEAMYSGQDVSVGGGAGVNE